MFFILSLTKGKFLFYKTLLKTDPGFLPGSPGLLDNDDIKPRRGLAPWTGKDNTCLN